jgi:hypothetical protein
MSVTFHATILASKNVRSLWEKLSFYVHLHGQMSIKRDIWQWVWAFGCKFEAYNTKMQFYEHMTVKHLFIIQGTGAPTGLEVLDAIGKTIEQFDFFHKATVSLGIFQISS